MNHPAPAQHVPRRRSRGFNLIEIMLAMGIFVIGFVAIAAVFPVGALLQKQTMDLVITQSIGRNIEALFEARPYTWSGVGGLNAALANNYQVQKVPASFENHWSPLMRRYPLDNLSLGHQHKYYWVPMLQRINNTTGVSASDVQAFIFVLQRAEGFVDYAPGGDKTTIAPAAEWANPTSDLTNKFIPGVLGKTETKVPSSNTFFMETQGFAPGDKILDNLGTVHTVLSATTNQIKVAGDIKAHTLAGVKPSGIWFGWSHQPGAANPVRDIIQIQNGKIAQ